MINKKHVSLLLAALLLCLAGLVPAGAEEAVDWAQRIPLNFASDTVKQQVTVKTFVDGDTVHFHVPETVMESGVLKARFLGVDTPEVTGKIEEYGKRAAAFTRNKLENAVSIIIESENDQWNKDSTGDRYLVWVWYKETETGPYRNLNIELLQNGLASPKSTASTRYGDLCMSALDQAKKQKLSIHSGQKDPDFYYGDAVELTLKELRSNPEAYNGIKVAFHGVITMNNNNSVYVEAYDAETDMYFGMSVYYGYALNGKGLEILHVGNEVRIVGTVQYYEAGNTWQVSDLNYRMMKPKDPGNIQKLSDGHQPSYVLTDAHTFNHGKVAIQGEEETLVFDYAPMAVATSVEMRDLKVVHAYTTQDEDSASNGAMTLICQAGEETIQVRTTVFHDENRVLITQDQYLGRVIDVKGIVDYYDGVYQIKVFTPASITLHP